jgi:hypothetical protein
MRLPVATLGILSFVGLVGAGTAACGDDPAAAPVTFAEAGALDARPVDATPVGAEDAGDAGQPADAAPDAADRTAPSRVVDLAGTPASATSVTLTWTAPSDDSGKVTAYDLRVSPTAMTTEAQFLAASAAAGAPIPGAAGSPQTATVTKLLPGTAYHFALRARDAAGNWSAVSNDATVSTKPRATFLVTEVAVSNAAAQGYDFIELTATSAGAADGIEIRQLTTVLHTLAPLDVALGDRIVVHATALPGPAGFAQEDATKNKAASTEPFAAADAYDVYSATGGLTGTDNLVSVVDGTTTLDAVAFANRDSAVATATMTAFAKAKTDATWTFAVTPTDGVNDCETEADAINVATSATETPCGGFRSAIAAGISLNRKGLGDTNSKADFYLAAQTPGAANAAVPVPTVASVSTPSATTVDLTFDQEIAPASVVAASFTIPGLNVSAAAASFNHVTLTTDAQAEGGYDVTLASTVTNFQGVPPSPLTAHFCGYAPLEALLTLNEVNPNITGSLDLIELAVTRGGPLTGFTLRANPAPQLAVPTSGTLLATLPAICAATGDLVVVHLTPAIDPATSETLAKNQLDSATYAQNYDNAWDVRGGNNGLTATNQVITIRNPGGTYVEGIAFSTMGAAASAQGFIDSLAFLQAQGLWLPADCGGVPCTDATVPSAKGVSASWSGVGTTPAGNSCQRIGVTNDASSWSVTTSTFGAGN